jgi:hypothetical protein
VEVFVVGDAELPRLGDVGTSIDGDIARIDQFAVAAKIA